MLIYKCDLCKEEISNPLEIYSLTILRKENNPYRGKEIEIIDMCSNCLSSIENYIQSLKKNGN